MDRSSSEAAPADGANEIPETSSRPPRLSNGAPRYPIPHRKLGAVEVPAVVQNIDRAVKAFGRVTSLDHALDSGRHSIPFYLNPESPFCKPLMSHNARTHNVVLKITVPKRTGRKRKRGSDGPWQGDVQVPYALPSEGDQVLSRARLDEPKALRRRLADNVGKYEVEAVGLVKHTHRFRGLADFYWDTGGRSDFAQRYCEQVLPGDVEKMKQFELLPGIDKGPNVDVIPPPVFTHMSLPFNYFYAQNPYVRVTDDGGTFNATAVKHVGHFIAAEDPTPTGPRHEPDMTDPRTVEIMAELQAAFEERPVWTRRSIMNHLGGKLRNWSELKKYLSYAAYQFKGGPWRDCVVPYGLDPRPDPKYRIYQSVMFKLLPRQTEVLNHPAWFSLHGSQNDPDNQFQPIPHESHIFDGETYQLDGKVWQVCDITDPILRSLIDDAAVRPTRDINSGWYHGGLWAKLKAIMKLQLIAIRFGRHLTREDFAMTLQAGDATPVGSAGGTSAMPLPQLHLTDEEMSILRGRGTQGKATVRIGYSVRVRTAAPQEESQPAEEESAVPEDDELVDFAQEDPEDDDESGIGSENELEEDRGIYEEDQGMYEYPDVPIYD